MARQQPGPDHAMHQQRQHDGPDRGHATPAPAFAHDRAQYGNPAHRHIVLLLGFTHCGYGASIRI
ncbi:hypothetical protein DY926_10605 [Komagataeibacter melaceti]|uniref:Uncharacterized protein n=2 Tax=Komagataeibacter melaceti TaxID=2766577 RepID=A0A371YZ89_9PROT|nr:hypothetical protein DY926_10605 [Komagataeibacter melaceti]